MNICPICANAAPECLVKSGIQYYQCWSCKTVFCGELDNDNKIGGVAEFERNTQQNEERIKRISTALCDVKDGPKILDFGCGHGYLVNDLKAAGFDATGYDAFNPEYDRLPKNNHFLLITAIEVIEHTTAPYYEIDVMYRSLVDRGMVIIETSFVDIAIEENIPLEDFFYIAPDAGHSTIFSHHGLDLLMAMKGFIPSPHWNRHVRSYTKARKKF